jgi:hypothetical protein
VASVGTCQVQVEKLDGPLVRGACVIGVAVPMAGTSAAKASSVAGRRPERAEGAVAWSMRVSVFVGGL